VLLGNVEFQHRHAAQLKTHANGVAERWVGSCRRDLLDHVIILNERHLKRLMSSYLLYYHEDRTHLGLAKDTPASRAYRNSLCA
jgi:transposase InsO family protein